MLQVSVLLALVFAYPSKSYKFFSNDLFYNFCLETFKCFLCRNDSKFFEACNLMPKASLRDILVGDINLILWLYDLMHHDFTKSPKKTWSLSWTISMGDYLRFGERFEA